MKGIKNLVYVFTVIDPIDGQFKNNLMMMGEQIVEVKEENYGHANFLLKHEYPSGEKGEAWFEERVADYHIIDFNTRTVSYFKVGNEPLHERLCAASFPNVIEQTYGKRKQH